MVRVICVTKNASAIINCFTSSCAEHYVHVVIVNTVSHIVTKGHGSVSSQGSVSSILLLIFILSLFAGTKCSFF